MALFSTTADYVGVNKDVQYASVGRKLGEQLPDWKLIGKRLYGCTTTLKNRQYLQMKSVFLYLNRFF